MPDPGDVTQLLRRWKINGDAEAEEQLFALVMSELHQVAARVLWQTPGFDGKVDPSELVSEAYVRLCDYSIETTNRKPFFFLIARAMRHYLMDMAKKRDADKRPQSQLRVVDSRALKAAPAASDIGVQDFYDSLDALKTLDPRQAEAIEFRVMGFEIDEIAQELGIARATVKRDIAKARAFLAYRLGLSANWIRA